MYCRNCGKEIADETNICEYCGFKEREVKVAEEKATKHLFCSYCGNEVHEDAVVCIHCGCSIKKEKIKNDNNESKLGIGILMALFLGIIGLVIGLALYQSGTYARKTFTNGFWYTFASLLLAVAVIYILFIFIFAGTFL